MKDARKWTEIRTRKPRVGAPRIEQPASSPLAGRILGLLPASTGAPLQLDARLKERVFRLATFLRVATGKNCAPNGGSHDRA